MWATEKILLKRRCIYRHLRLKFQTKSLCLITTNQAPPASTRTSTGHTEETVFETEYINTLSAHQLARVSITFPLASRTSIFTAMLPSILCVAQDKHGS